MATQTTQIAFLALGCTATVTFALAKLILVNNPNFAPPAREVPEMYPLHVAFIIAFNVMAIVYTSPATRYHTALIVLFCLSVVAYAWAYVLAWKNAPGKPGDIDTKMSAAFDDSMSVGSASTTSTNTSGNSIVNALKSSVVAPLNAMERNARLFPGLTGSTR